MVRRQPAGTRKGGQFAPDMSGKTPPTPAPGKSTTVSSAPESVSYADLHDRFAHQADHDGIDVESAALDRVAEQLLARVNGTIRNMQMNASPITLEQVIDSVDRHIAQEVHKSTLRQREPNIPEFSGNEASWEQTMYPVLMKEVQAEARYNKQKAASARWETRNVTAVNPAVAAHVGLTPDQGNRLVDAESYDRTGFHAVMVETPDGDVEVHTVQTVKGGGVDTFQSTVERFPDRRHAYRRFSDTAARIEQWAEEDDQIEVANHLYVTDWDHMWRPLDSQ